ncbi:MAG TPA: hypothetical protein VJK48_06820 [Chlamydiales bacterium]|nr:hypothetical protein [Chlamydiales bacterium]
MSAIVDTPPIQTLEPSHFNSTTPVTLESIEKTQEVAKRQIQQLSLTYAVVSLTLNMEKLTSQKVHNLSDEIKRKEATIHLLLDLKKELHAMKEGDSLSEKAITLLDQLATKNIQLWNKESTLTQKDQENLLESISSELQPLHSDIQKTLTLDLARLTTQNSTIINIAQDIVRLVSKHISNILERMRH